MLSSSLLRSSLPRRTTSLAGMFMAYQITRLTLKPCPTTLMEAPKSAAATKIGHTTDSSTSRQKKTMTTTTTTTLFYPQDVYYNPQTKAALARIRFFKRDELPDDLSSVPAENNKQDDRDGTKDDNTTKNRSTQQQEQQQTGAADAATPPLQSPTVLTSSGTKHMGTMTLIGYKGGTLESQVNQDRAIVAVPFFVSDKERRLYELEQQQQQQQRRQENEQSSSSPPIRSRLLGVFDGHARLGERVSQYSVTELPKLVASKLDALSQKRTKNNNGEVVVAAAAAAEEEDPDDVVRILKEAFIEIDKTAPAEISGGCTASIILQRHSKVYVANAGDSRSFLVAYRPSRQTVEVIYMSREDKPHLHDERARVERMGGEVYLPLVGTSRVLYTDPETGMQSGLAMSRSIGDWEVGGLGVIAEPIVDVMDIDDIVQTQMERDCQIPDEDETMDSACFFSADDVYILAVSASDGLMDFATPELVAQTLAVSLYHEDGPHLLTALEQLIYVAAQGWEQTKQGRYRDDIAIAVSEIRSPPMAKEAVRQ